MTQIYLSHFLSDSTPGYGGEKIFHCDEASSIKKGRTANSVKVHFNNHSSTHIDFPKHFDDHGKSLSDYPADFWIFHKIWVTEYQASENEIIELKHLNLEKMPKDCEFLIIKTHFEKKRNDKAYWNNNPGYAEEIGHYLRENFPKLRIIGFDSISLTSFQNRAIGKLAHQAFLLPYKNHEPILIVEDMHLSELNQSPRSLICAPLMLEGADGVPVTIIAEI